MALNIRRNNRGKIICLLVDDDLNKASKFGRKQHFSFWVKGGEGGGGRGGGIVFS